jgi:hypothetical protein
MLKRNRRRELRPRIKGNMNPLVEKLADLSAQRSQVLATARAITDKKELTALDRKHFEEMMELLDEIKDYSVRLTRRGEKWKTYEQRTRTENQSK